ncbi:MAG: hypothetical protein WC055_10010 [Melioribacteraceae bacterium]
MQKNYRAVISLEYIERSYNHRRSIIKKAYGELYDDRIHLQDSKTPELIKRVRAGQKPSWIRNAYGDYVHVKFDDDFECGISSSWVERWEEIDSISVSFKVKKNKGTFLREDLISAISPTDVTEMDYVSNDNRERLIQNEGRTVGEREYSAELFQVALNDLILVNNDELYPSDDRVADESF